MMHGYVAVCRARSAISVGRSLSVYDDGPLNADDAEE